MYMRLTKTICAMMLALPAAGIFAHQVINNGAALENHTNQNDLKDMTLKQIRKRGLKVFSTPFTKADGYGDGPAGLTAEDRAKNGGRPTINNNGTFLRINGLDSQTCLECHSVISRATIPMRFGIGGVGGINNSPVGGATFFNTNNDEKQINPPAGVLGTTGQFNINGRVINPPFLFGSGGVELVGNEMTEDLQALKNNLQNGRSVSLDTKGVNFGTLTRNSDGTLDASTVVGIESNVNSENFLVVQPFGRKGNNKTTRTFDQDAMQFHLGMQSDEILYKEEYGVFPAPELDGTIKIDGDGDLVENEMMIGDLSVLSAFNATLERPVQRYLGTAARKGRDLFNDVGCASCHTPVLETRSHHLGLRYPEVADDPSANIFLDIDLTTAPMYFRSNSQGGISVELFADLKTHDMGPALAEASGDANFTTIRLWGVADTAPYLHDGRALTIREAIDMHGQPGSEAEPAVRAFFDDLSQEQRDKVYTFLGKLRTPRHPAEDLF